MTNDGKTSRLPDSIRFEMILSQSRMAAFKMCPRKVFYTLQKVQKS